MKPRLEEMQHWMKFVLTHPAGAQAAVRESDKWIEFVNSDENSNISRLDIYAEAYFARILDAFNADFPITAFVLGSDQFAKFVAEYLKVYPSTESNLNNVSKSVAAFIKNYSQSTAIRDIVTLERLALESFYSPLDAPFEPQTLATLQESDWEKIKFNLNSSLRFIDSSWPLEILWENRHDLKNATIKENEEQNYYIVERISYDIHLSKVSKTQFLILKKISEGASLSSLGEQDFNSEEENISTLFAEWMQKSYFKNYYF